MQKVVIVTRRFNENYSGLGVKEDDANHTPNPSRYRYESHPVSDDFLFFWADVLIDNPLLKETAIDKSLLPADDPSALWEILKTDVTRKSLQNIFDKLDSRCNVKIEKTEYLTTIKEFFIENDSTCIFVYHHWLDKQRFVSDKKKFLKALRKDVEKIMNKKIEDRIITEYDNEINWLIHDSDILSAHYNDIFYFKGEILHNNAENFDYLSLIPDNLKSDNIWCFTHESNSSGFYKNIILDFHDKEFNADSLYNELAWDKTGSNQRLELLGLNESDLQSKPLSSEILTFILQKKPNTLGISVGITVEELTQKIEQ
jgi:hypothetical protein